MKHPVLACSCFGAFFVLACLAHAVAVEKCVTVRVTNCYARTVTVTYGPATVCAEARVQPDARHRWLEMSMEYAPPDALAEHIGVGADALDQDDPLREAEKQDGPVPASLMQIDGASERLHERKYRDLSGGTFIVTATTYSDESRKKICGRDTARVIVR